MLTRGCCSGKMNESRADESRTSSDNSTWSEGSVAQPGSVRFQGDSTSAANGERVSSEVSSLLTRSCCSGKTNESGVPVEVESATESATVTEAEDVGRGAEADATGVGRPATRFANFRFLTNWFRML